MAIICQENESRHNGFQCIMRMTSGTDSYEKKRKCKECLEELECGHIRFEDGDVT